MAALVSRPGTTTTWLNHWSLLNADWQALSRLDLIGIDGTLLQMLLAASGATVKRSSADLVLPAVLDGVDRVALVGAAPGVAARAARRLAPREVLAVDGFGELRALRADMTPLVDFDPTLVVVGLGAGLQDAVAHEISTALPGAAVCTAGGWIDQYAAAADDYFPAWVHALRLGWAWRIAHEPRRLIGRYTVDALRFLLAAPVLLRRLKALGSVQEWGVCLTTGDAKPQ
ncbi:WecB/TagA/CpsF family glycosyltransferase [Schaalia sp. 19OD2882]|nr:WecB/TagA/CpsF family glycosyltransferase [Schaalia sp. 19OD2882]